MPKGGYMGKILEIDLDSQKALDNGLPRDDVLRKYIGCFGLGLKLFYDRFELGTDPLSPDNPMILLTGPLTGIPQVPSPTNSTITTLNADTGFTVGRSHSHGWFGTRIKKSGYDGIILTGTSDEWVYLWINDGEVEFRDAKDLLGKDTHETEDLVKEELGYTTEMPGEVSVAAIGPAGENLCDGALIENDKHKTFAHSGVGKVMGSKKIKAIAVRGEEQIPVYDEERIKEITKEWRDNLEESDAAAGLGDAGIPHDEYGYAKSASITTARNMLEVPSPDHEWGKGMSKHNITPKPCFACPTGCSYEIELSSGPHKGYVGTIAGGGENLEGAASIVGVYDSDWVHYLIDQCDRLGFESSTIGCTMAVLIESYEEGLITKEDIGGTELEWGNPELVEKLLKMAANREGVLGEVLARGPKYAAEWVGGDAPDRAIHIKGAGMNLHDWRASQGIMLGQIVGGGSGWPAPAADAWAVPVDAGYEEYEDPIAWEKKPKAVVKTWPIKYWDDSNGTCWFATWGVPNHMKMSAEAVSAATGWDFLEEEAMQVGERLVHLERVMNVRLGLEPEDDLNVPERMVSAPPEGKAKGVAMKDHLEWMVREVYRLNGWDENTGKPQRETLRKVNLGKCIDDIWE